MFEPLETNRLIIRNWRASDRELFFKINHDDEVMAFFPFRRNRQQAAELMEILKQDIDNNGFGFTALELKATGEVLGFCGLNQVDIGEYAKPGAIEIGWRLAFQYWGNGYASEAAMALLDFAFTKMNLDEVISFAVIDNLASIAVMERIGMHPVRQRYFSHPGVSESHPHLQMHAYYEITRQDWHKAKNKAAE